MSHIWIEERQGPYHSIGIITLNRPDALNAINQSMLETLARTLHRWDKQPHIQLIVIQGQGRAFCAGGDLKIMLDPSKAQTFLQQAYRCIYQLACMQTPTLAWTHGITMGGGTGIMRHCQIRIGAPDLCLAMPETAIGFIPDVGASHFLAQCPGYSGRYMALTSKRLDAYEALALGFIAYIMDAHDVSNALDYLLHTPFCANPITDIRAHLTKHMQPTHHPAWIESINSWFSAPDHATLIARLQASTTPLAQTTLEALETRSPWSLCLTEAALHCRSARDHLKHALNIEYALAQKCLLHPDLTLGIAAALSRDKTPPIWSQTKQAHADDVQQWIQHAIKSNPLNL